MKRLSLILIFIFILISAFPQNPNENFQFAVVSDTHIGSNNSVEDLRGTVKDINENDSLSFIIFSGDVTEFGTDSELQLAKQIIDSLNKPYYIIPGNHDTKWSESGGNSFKRIFGAETFSFMYKGFRFIGTNSGPNMRMGPGQIPKENIVWLDSLLFAQKEKHTPVIYVNHYPPASDLNNGYEVIDRLKKHNIQLTLSGHLHINKQIVSEGIPGLVCRSNLRAQDTINGYNIMHVFGDTLLTASVRFPGKKTSPSWAIVKLFDHQFPDSINHYPRPDFSMNKLYPFVKELWRVEEKSDIGAGVSISGNRMISTNTAGDIKAYNINKGKLLWKCHIGAKIYSTPAIKGNMVVGAATNGTLYAISLHSGKLFWKFDLGEPVVASPVIFNNQVFIAGSWGKCYSINLDNGKINWSNNEIKGFVETIPRVYKGMILFGTWANHFYAIDAQTGRIKWDWNNEYKNRMLSPAACVPVAFQNRVYWVAPDNKMTCLNAETGAVVWQSRFKGKRVRESMGVSCDSTIIYAKTMEGDIIGVQTSTTEGKIIWNAGMNAGYDIAPSVISEYDGKVFIPADKGLVYAVDRNTGKMLWVHRISSCLINQVLPVDKHTVVCTSMDGVITRIFY